MYFIRSRSLIFTYKNHTNGHNIMNFPSDVPWCMRRMVASQEVLEPRLVNYSLICIDNLLEPMTIINFFHFVRRFKFFHSGKFNMVHMNLCSFFSSLILGQKNTYYY